MSLRPLLVVEDDQRDLDLVIAALERAAVRNPVHTMRDGREAIAYLRASKTLSACPALTLLDIKLPSFSGHEVLREVRAWPSYCQMPVVMLSGSRLPNDVSEAYASGANAYLVKPISFRDFIQSVRATLTFWLGRNVPPPHGCGPSRLYAG